MSQLLNTIKTKFEYNPEIRIIVTGYYKSISEYTNMGLNPEKVKEALGIQDSDKSWLATRWQVFRDESTRALELAVNEANIDLDQRQFFFAVPDFKDENAFFAFTTYLWPVARCGPSLICYPYPLDDVKDDRFELCDEHYGSGLSDEKVGCYIASMAHPSRGGARVYANAIESLLPDVGLPVWVTQEDGATALTADNATAPTPATGAPAPAPTPPEICDNSEDDDGDGGVDEPEDCPQVPPSGGDDIPGLEREPETLAE
jgi:hypothetical protein